MARTRSVTYCTIWSDQDWRKLSVGAQWLYGVILSQSRLSLAGCLVMQPSRWTGFATNPEVPPWLAELEQHGYIVTDADTDELVVRTFVLHDVFRGDPTTKVNRNLIAGLWTAWQSIESLSLRQVVVDNLPDSAWMTVSAPPPPMALQMRRSDRLEPVVATAGSNRPIEPPPPPPSPSPVPGSDRSSDALDPSVIDLGTARARQLAASLAVGAGATSAEERENG